MHATLRQIRSFIVVARLGSFTQAAKALHLSQPTLTVQIRQLEESLGVQLFDRNTRSVHLTRIGRELAPQLDRLDEELAAVLSRTRGVGAGRSGAVRLACIPSFAASVLPEAITTFRAKHPQVSFSLKDVNWGSMVAMVRSEEVDFGVGDMPAVEPDLAFIQMMEDRMQVVYRQDHPIGAMRTVTLAKLAEHSMVMMDPGTSARRTIDAAFGAAGCYPPRACEVMYVGTAAAMVRAGLGFAVLPASAIEWRAHPGLAVRLINDPAFVRRVGIIKKSGRSLPPPSEAFTQALLKSWRRTRRLKGASGGPN